MNSAFMNIISKITIVFLLFGSLTFVLPAEVTKSVELIPLLFSPSLGGGLFLGLEYIVKSFVKIGMYLFSLFVDILFLDYRQYDFHVIAFYSNIKELDPVLYGCRRIKEDNFGFISVTNQICADVLKLSDWSLWYNTESPIFVKGFFLFLTTTVTSLFFMSYLGIYGVFIVNISSLFFFWLSSLLAVIPTILEKKTFTVSLFKWINFNFTKKVFFELYLDYISISFSTLTISIALCVYIYCFSYFRGEPNVERLVLFINLFVLSMILLVTSGNTITLFLGWELIGLTSFFLINFWSTRTATLKSAFKAFSFNKLSDIFIFLSLCTMYVITDETSIVSILSQVQIYSNQYFIFAGLEVSFIEFTSLCLMMASFIKSAQFGSHVWLPDSMEAPVPASALIHSATLVSAGVFVLLRFNSIITISIVAQWLLPVLGSFTAFIGGISACYQSDVKKALAYSTISHCGFLMVCVSTNVPECTLYYLYVHGFFKAASFLCVGNIIRFSLNYQDFRKMGAFYKYMPFEFYFLVLSLFNLCGLPFTLGFFIKHYLILELPNTIGFFVSIHLIGGALTGLLYCYRILFYVFFDSKKGKKYIYMQNKTVNIEHYSNTTKSSSIAIIFINIMAYVICWYLFTKFFSGFMFMYEIPDRTHINAALAELKMLTNSSSFYLGYINWLILIALFCVLVVSWRFKFRSYISIYAGYIIIVVALFVYGFWHLY